MARWLEGLSHDVFSVYDLARGMDDEDILRKASEENWILITNHLACAETAADTFLTVDDKVIKRATDRAGELDLKVLNPIDFVRTEISK